MLTRDVGVWVTQLVRTLKTCRLYDVNNPTVVRFREELMQGLQALLDRHGQVRLLVASRELTCGGAPVYVAQSRDDNLAATLHRDGIRAITFLAGIGPRELDFLLDQILHVTSPSAGDDDLVTLLWEANLPGLDIGAVPVEGDIDGEVEGQAEDKSPLPWPKSAGQTGESGAGGASGADQAGETRSDDWDVAEDSLDHEMAYDELESSAIHDMARLQQALESESSIPVVTRAVEALTDCLATDSTPSDRYELGRFIPRVLREAIVTGDWQAALTALTMLRACDPGWSPVAFFEGMVGGASAALTRKAVAALDGQGPEGVEAFLTLAMEFGEASADWLMLVLAESRQKRTRRPLARTIAALVRSHPERLLPWMADDRWYVVRNVVHVLGWIGDDAIAEHLRAAIHHPEIRVRREVVSALGSVSPEVSRPILMGMLAGAEPHLFTTIVHQLSLSSDPHVERCLIEMLRGERFHERSEEERRAVYMALASQGDGVLPALEEELNRGGLFVRGRDLHWQAVARCIARIGTPAARAALDRCSQATREGVRKACDLAVASLQAKHD